MYVTFKVLEFFTIAHPACHVSVILKFFYATFYNAIVITCQNSKLPRMKAETNIQRPSKITHLGKFSFAKISNCGLPPKPLPIRLSVYRQYVTAKSNHSKIFFKISYPFNEFVTSSYVVFH